MTPFAPVVNSLILYGHGCQLEYCCITRQAKHNYVKGNAVCKRVVNLIFHLDLYGWKTHLPHLSASIFSDGKHLNHKLY